MRLTFVPVCLLALLSFTSAPSRAADSAAPTPDAALAKLKEGNARYVKGASLFPRIDPARRESTAKQGQFPIATILGCSDSRVPPEIIFDQKFANLFVIRVAGNVTGDSEIASAEYGTHYLHTPLIVVLGHSGCGAVDAALAEKSLKGSLPKLMEMISPALTEARNHKPPLTGAALLDAAVEDNVRHSMKMLLSGSSVISEDIKNNKVKLVGAVRDLQTGKVKWLAD